jgi:hypothetical protein
MDIQAAVVGRTSNFADLFGDRASSSRLSPPRRFSRDSNILDRLLGASWPKKRNRDEEREYQEVAR